MKTFTIDSENSIRAATQGRTPPSGASFSTEAELAALAQHWSGARLVEIWNRLPGVQPVRKFTNRQTAVRRIWRALNDSKRTRKAAPAKKGNEPRRTAKQSGNTPATKTEGIIALLRQPEGATLKAIMALTSWQPHSVRGFISAQLGKRMGLRIKSFTRQGERVYRIRG